MSWSTRNGYPPSQEIFWFGFALAVASLVAWALSRVAARFPCPPQRQVVLEALGASSVLALVFFPASFALALAGVCAVATGVLISARAEILPERDAAPSRASPRGLRGVPFAICAILLALLLSPSFWLRVVEVSRGTPDEAYATDGWLFQAEWGQFLAWADGLRNGQAPGRDFYMLYGPLYPLGVVAAWNIFGRSVAAWALYYASLNILAVLAAIALAARLVRRRVLCLALPFVLLPIAFEYGQGLELRYGLALAGLACLCRAFERDSVAWIAAGGVLGGTGLFFSQEFGIAFLLTAAAGLGMRSRRRELLAFLTGFAVATVPCALWLAQVGALLPTLHDLASYPALVMAGFGKLPFESAVRALPISPESFRTESVMKLRLGYTIPAVCWAALLWALRVERLDPRRPVASLRSLRTELIAEPQRLGVALLALFGLLGFRSALGRSSLLNTLRVCGGASILIAVALDRALDAMRR
ncbi:MAG TPA: hypothetical protein VEG67_04050, partial [Myxococcota bacterium]|nr:hypothetical protein [Myxococcota bacterium]